MLFSEVYMSKKPGLELLAPAGNPEIFRAVIAAGADAVYFGGDAFGARSYAKNFTAEEGADAIRFAHLYGKKAYLTVNTLVKNPEMERRLYHFLKHYYESGVDAVIVQDFGVLSFVRAFFPELPIHASTQMTVCSAPGAEFLVRAGAERIVTSRELSLEEIAQIYRECPCEIETFVHGALCVCYSGQCLMSSLIGGRSGNRGRCAQPCRLPYDVLDSSGEKLKTPGKYMISPKDLCAIDLIPQMAEAGIYSLKIEGRMKQLSYAAGVVSVYRKYVDAYLENGKEAYRVRQKDREFLAALGSRNGFTDAYLRGISDRKMMSFTEGAHRKTEAEWIPSESKLQATGTFTALAGKKMQFVVSCGETVVEMTGEQETEKAIKRVTTEAEIREKLEKTGGTPFEFAKLTLKVDDGLFLPMTQINALRQLALTELERRIYEKNTGPKRRINPYLESETEKNAVKKKEQLECLVTVRTEEQFEACVKSTFPGKIAIAAELPEIEEKTDAVSFYQKMAETGKKEFYILLPPVLRTGVRSDGREQLIRYLAEEKDRHSFGIIAASYDELGLLDRIGFPRERILLDHRLYTFNNRSKRAFQDLGYRMFTAPYELKAGEFAHCGNEGSYLTIYGRAVLMVTASCLTKNISGCSREKKKLFLQDRFQNRFPVLNHCEFCYNEIFNSKILNLFTERDAVLNMGFSGIRMDFTLESRKETERILKQAQAIFSGADSFEDSKNRKKEDKTKGHWRRGVE